MLGANKACRAKVYLLGDSITQGLGSRKVNFAGELKRMLGNAYEVENLACTGTMINYASELLEKGEVNPPDDDGVDAFCVILYGNVDAQIRPNTRGRVFPRIPKRYQGGGMLMPRPFYSNSLLKRVAQRFDNMQRRLYAGAIKLIDGTEQWMPLDLFVTQYAEVLENLIELGIKAIPCTCVYIDERLFPGSLEQYEQYNEEIKRLATVYSLQYIDIFNLLKFKVNNSNWNSYYNKDHFHPNGAGYEVMASEIAKVVSNCAEGGNPE